VNASVGFNVRETYKLSVKFSRRLGFNVSIVSGSVPLSLLCMASIVCNSESNPISDGIVPVMRFELKSKLKRRKIGM